MESAKGSSGSRTGQVTPERINQFAWAYTAPLFIEAALNNKVFDTLDAGPMSVEQVSEKSGASVRGLRMVMDALVGFQLLTKQSDGRYALAPESAAFLVTTKPSFQGGIF